MQKNRPDRSSMPLEACVEILLKRTL